jgi:hypothetical protein
MPNRSTSPWQCTTPSVKQGATQKKTMARAKWDRSKVIATIQRLKRAGESIAYHHVHTNKNSLARAAVYHFRTYRRAVIAAGIDYDHKVRLQRRWTPDLVIKQIRRRRRTRQDLSPGYLSKNSRPLYLAACTHFGSYRKAVSAAGIDYVTVLRPQARLWPADRVLAEIRRQYRQGKDVSHNAMRAGNQPLASGAVRQFGSYAAAAKAAGIDYQGIKNVRRWTEARVIAALRKLKRRGRDLSSTAMKLTHGRLYAAAQRHFETYERALAAIGIDPAAVSRIQRWSKERVIKELRRRHRSGKSLSARVMHRQEPKLHAAAYRLFGSHPAAVCAAGIDHAPRASGGGRRSGVTAGAAGHWTERSVLRTLRELYREGKDDLRHRAMKRSHHSLFWAATELYGSYVNAVWAAGIDYDEVVREALRAARVPHSGQRSGVARRS